MLTGHCSVPTHLQPPVLDIKFVLIHWFWDLTWHHTRSQIVNLLYYIEYFTKGFCWKNLHKYLCVFIYFHECCPAKTVAGNKVYLLYWHCHWPVVIFHVTYSTDDNWFIPWLVNFMIVFFSPLSGDYRNRKDAGMEWNGLEWISLKPLKGLFELNQMAIWP